MVAQKSLCPGNKAVQPGSRSGCVGTPVGYEALSFLACADEPQGSSGVPCWLALPRESPVLRFSPFGLEKESEHAGLDV